MSVPYLDSIPEHRWWDGRVGLGSGCHRMSLVASRHCQCVWLLHERYLRISAFRRWTRSSPRGIKGSPIQEAPSQYRGDDSQDTATGHLLQLLMNIPSPLLVIHEISRRR